MSCNKKNFIRYLKKQKESALEFILNEYGGLVHAVSNRILSSFGQEVVDECMNDVFLSVWQNAHQFTGDDLDFKKWIGMVTKYKAIDLYRQLEKQRHRENSDTDMIEIADREDIQARLLDKEMKHDLLLAISNLGELDRDIFMMKYFLGMTSQEIVQQTGLSITAIDNRVYRGRKKLAQNKSLKERFV